MPNYNSILTLFMSVSIFEWFKHLEIKNSIALKSINWIAPSTFAVYLIHDNLYFKNLLFSFFQWDEIYDSPVFIIDIILISIAIFMLCILVDQVRRIIFLLFVDKLIKDFGDFLDKKLRDYFQVMVYKIVK